MSENINVEIVDPRSFAASVADEIVASVTDCIHEKGKCSVALAGGGTPATIYRVLGRPPRAQEIEWDKTQIFFGDERFVSADDVRSNFRMVDETFLGQVKIPAENVHRFNISLGSPEACAQDYEAQILAAVPVNESGAPVFDLLLLGLGGDGHTVSIFPNSELLQGPTGAVRAVKAPDGEWRVTITPEVILAARRILFIVGGSQKAVVVKRALEGVENVGETPAQLYRRVSSRVTWFIDSAAAVQLENQK